MTSLEEPLVFACRGARLIGILHRGSKSASTGLVVVVGGPQYRVGSHRQFLLLARYVALNGFPVLRFDYRGMGDSDGNYSGFNGIDADIASAIDAFCVAVPALQSVVLWGLCDAASAAMFYAHRDPRVSGIVLLNPWIRTEATEARTYLRHYYLSHLKNPDLWRRMVSGRLSFSRAGRALIRNLAVARRPSASDTIGDDTVAFPERMLRGLQNFKGKVLLILSGNDLTAAEFRDAVSASHRWREVIERPEVVRRELPEASHTFSCKAWRDQVAVWTLEWMQSS